MKFNNLRVFRCVARAAGVLVLLLVGPSAHARDLVGVIDLKGNYIIPAKFQRIHYMRNGKFSCQDFDGKITFWDEDGQAAKVKVPEGTHPLVYELSLAPKPDDRSSDKIQHSPYPFVHVLANGLYVADFGSDESRLEPPVVLDENSDTILKLPSHYRVLREPKSTIVAVNEWSDRALIFYDKAGHFIREMDNVQPRGFVDGLTAITKRDGPDDTVIDETGTVVYTSPGDRLEPVGPERLIKTTRDRQFIRSLWLPHTDERRPQFENFLAANQLVGMDVATLVKTLGPSDYKYLGGYTGPEAGADSFGYTLSGFGSTCGNAYTHVEFKPEAGRIKGWKVNNHGVCGPGWITSNEIRTLSQAEEFGNAMITEELKPKHKRYKLGPR
jgi:hypothetical protein